MKHYFEEPAIRVELFRVEDVVTTSVFGIERDPNETDAVFINPISGSAIGN